MRYAVLCIIGVSSIGAATPSADPPTDDHAFSQGLAIEMKDPDTSVFGRYLHELRIADRIYYDRFGHPSRTDWLFLQDLYGYGIHESLARGGKNVVFDAILDSARETAVDVVPFEAWGQSVEEWGQTNTYNPSWMARVASWTIRTSIGNTEEEDIEMVSAKTSYRSISRLKRFSWQNGDGSWKTIYGWRVWRDNPYVYLNNSIGHFKDRPLIYTSVRCYGYLRPGDFGLIKLETQATVAISDRTQMVIGGSFCPLDDERPDSAALSIRLERVILGGVGSIGAATSTVGNSYRISWGKRF